MSIYRYNVFGREVLIEKIRGNWSTFYVGPEGKRRRAGIFIPPDISEADLTQFLSDLCHEWATEKHQEVVRISEQGTE
ncbi:DUF7661 family protein [Microbulbifer celer]|uniref:DUF7661 family protein n=1 Tax=Microbulbifer celer TaxID=435905 RepID=UPI003B97BBDA